MDLEMRKQAQGGEVACPRLTKLLGSGTRNQTQAPEARTCAVNHRLSSGTPGHTNEPIELYAVTPKAVY